MSLHIAALMLWLGGSVLGLREIDLTVPEAVGLGSTAVLGCKWALDAGESLYTVKWYHGPQEFFRFVPKELPNTRVFSQTGVSVDVSRSGAQQVVLRGATHDLTGRYRCEVSADAPFFHTVFKSGTMRVVELPKNGPRVHTQKSWYSVGDMLRANCTSPPADPPANLTWLLNGQEVKGLDIPPHTQVSKKPVITDTSLDDANRIIFSPWDALSGYDDQGGESVIDVPAVPQPLVQGSVDSRKAKESTSRPMTNKWNATEHVSSNKSSSLSQLVIRVQSVHFHKGRLNVTCVARVMSAWAASGVLLIDEERPQIAPVMGSPDSSSSGTTQNYVSGATMLTCYLLRKCKDQQTPVTEYTKTTSEPITFEGQYDDGNSDVTNSISPFESVLEEKFLVNETFHNGTGT